MDRILHGDLNETPSSNLSPEDKKFVKLKLTKDFLAETLKDYQLAQQLIEKYPKNLQNFNNKPELLILKKNLEKLIEEIKIILEYNYLDFRVNELCSEVFQFNNYINVIRKSPVIESEDNESLLNLLQFRNLEIDQYMMKYNKLSDLNEVNLGLKIKLMRLESTIKEKYQIYKELKLKEFNKSSTKDNIAENGDDEDTDPDSEKVKEQQKQIELLRKKSTVLYNVFKGLVLESDIDWFSDPKLFNLMKEDFEI